MRRASARTSRALAQGLGVVHRVGTVERVELDEPGAIAGVRDARARHAAARACTSIAPGSAAELIGRALGVPFRTRTTCCSWIAPSPCRCRTQMTDAPIPPYTISTAHEAGWTWDIALPPRRGVGYVYSSRHTDGTARRSRTARLRGRRRARISPARHLKLQVGWRAQHWVKNCVAVGLSGGFLEPLESTGIILIEAAAYHAGRRCTAQRRPRCRGAHVQRGT